MSFLHGDDFIQHKNTLVICKIPYHAFCKSTSWWMKVLTRTIPESSHYQCPDASQGWSGYVYIESAPKAFPVNISDHILLRLNYPQSSRGPSDSRIQFWEAISSINAGPSTLSVILYFLYIQMIGPAIASTSQAQELELEIVFSAPDNLKAHRFYHFYQQMGTPKSSKKKPPFPSDILFLPGWPRFTLATKTLFFLMVYLRGPSKIFGHFNISFVGTLAMLYESSLCSLLRQNKTK